MEITSQEMPYLSTIRERTTRIKNLAETIIPEIPTKPNDKIALDIYGPLSETRKGNKYLLRLQDRLTRYTI